MTSLLERSSRGTRLGPSRAAAARTDARIPSRFPAGAAALSADGASSTAAPGARAVVLWHGEREGALRSLAADHVSAAGAELRDAGRTASGPIAPGLGGQADQSLQGPGEPAPALHLCPAEALLTADHLPAPAGQLIAVADAPIAEGIWRRALSAQVRAVCRLPEDSAALLALLSGALRAGEGARVIGVAGGCGGAGASSFAARLAGAAGRLGPVALIDADPLGGGLELLVEAPPAAGARWEDLAGIDTADGALLREGLPRVDGVHLLTAGAGAPPRALDLDRALGALARVPGHVIADLSPDLVGPALPHLDELLIVLPARDHAVRAAWRRLGFWRPPAGVARLVLRGRGPVSADEAREDLRLPVAGVFRDSPASHVPLLDVRRGRADALCRRLLEAGL